MSGSSTNTSNTRSDAPRLATAWRPIYFVEVPGWESKDFEQQCAAWVAELRRRQHFDLRPWFHAGEEALREAHVQERMRQLHEQIKERITRGERAEASLGNVDPTIPISSGAPSNCAACVRP